MPEKWLACDPKEKFIWKKSAGAGEKIMEKSRLEIGEKFSNLEKFKTVVGFK